MYVDKGFYVEKGEFSKVKIKTAQRWAVFSRA